MFSSKYKLLKGEVILVVSRKTELVYFINVYVFFMLTTVWKTGYCFRENKQNLDLEDFVRKLNREI